MSEVKFCKVWAVYDGGDDRSWGYPSEYYSEHTTALIAAKDKGPYGGDAHVEEKPAVIVDGLCYILKREHAVDLDLLAHKRKEEVKQQALKKLSPEERAALGVK